MSGVVSGRGNVLRFSQYSREGIDNGAKVVLKTILNNSDYFSQVISSSIWKLLRVWLSD